MQDGGDQILAAPTEQADQRVDPRLQRLGGAFAGARDDRVEAIAAGGEFAGERAAATLDQFAQRFDARAQCARHLVAAPREQRLHRLGGGGEFVAELPAMRGQSRRYRIGAGAEGLLHAVMVLADQTFQPFGMLGQGARRRAMRGVEPLRDFAQRRHDIGLEADRRPRERAGHLLKFAEQGRADVGGELRQRLGERARP